MAFDTEYVSKQSVLRLSRRINFSQYGVVEVRPTFMISPDLVKRLPAATNIVTREPAEWIPSSNVLKYKLFHTHICSRCCHKGKASWSYCPKCGSSMRGDNNNG